MTLVLNLGDRAPASVADFDCYGVLVTGPGIPGEASDGKPEDDALPRTNHCTYPGVASSFVAASAAKTKLEVTIPRGSDRLIQVVGLEDPAGEGCPNTNVAKFLSASRAKSSAATVYGGLYEIGRTVEDIITTNQEIQIDSSYDPAANLRTCVGKTAYPDLVLTPKTLTVPPSGYYQFTATGGVGALTAELVNSSNQLVTGFGSDGILQSSPTTGTYRARIEDTKGNIREAVVEVTLPGGSPIFWFRADFYWALGPGTSYPAAGQVWSNSVPVTADLVPAGGAAFTRSGGPNGHPVLTLGASSEFTYGGLSTLNIGPAHVFVVAAATAPNGGFFCIGRTSNCLDPGGSIFIDLASGLLTGNAFNTATDTTSTAPYPLTPFISELEWTPASEVKLTVDATGTSYDTSVFATTPTAAGFTITSGGTIQIGRTSANFSGQVAEVLVYPSVLTGSNLTSVRTYLKEKYSID